MNPDRAMAKPVGEDYSIFPKPVNGFYSVMGMAVTISRIFPCF
jgi:hypothetical protein